MFEARANQLPLTTLQLALLLVINHSLNGDFYIVFLKQIEKLFSNAACASAVVAISEDLGSYGSAPTARACRLSEQLLGDVIVPML